MNIKDCVNIVHNQLEQNKEGMVINLLFDPCSNFKFSQSVINVLQELNNALKWSDLNTVKQCIKNPVLQLEYSVQAKDMQYAYELLLV